MTATVARLWRDRAPRDPTTVSGLYEDWVMRMESGHLLPDPCERYTAEQPTWRDAVRVACDSRYPRGEGKRRRMVMWHHQSKVRQPHRDEFARQIVRAAPDIPCMDEFDELYAFLRGVAPYGIGPVTIYDVAVRLSRFLRLPVTQVYTKAGVGIGLRALGIDIRGREAIPMEELPGELRAIITEWGADPNDIEDFLCTYRDHFNPGMIAQEREDS